MRRNDMNDNYDRAPAALEAEVSRGLTQSGFINRVFGWMTAGLALTGAISYGIAHSSMSEFVLANQGTYLLLILLELGVVIGLSAAINRLSATVATLGFLLFAVLNGLTLSWIFLAYEPSSIYATFFVTSGTFGGRAFRLSDQTRPLRRGRHRVHGALGADPRDDRQYLLDQFDGFALHQLRRGGDFRRADRVGHPED